MPHVTDGSADARHIGKENRMVAAIVDDGFAAMIIKAANSDLTHNGGAMND